MATSFSRKKTVVNVLAVELNMANATFLCSLFAVFVLTPFSISASATESQTSSNTAPVWQTYIVVSSSMPKSVLISLAEQASSAGAIMVMNGFPSTISDFSANKEWIMEINSSCCRPDRYPQWVIDPALVKLYSVNVAPTFLLVSSINGRQIDHSSISGDIDLPNALKFIGQKSQSQTMKDTAMRAYTTIYGGY